MTDQSIGAASFATGKKISEVSLARLYALRATYLLIVVGLGVTIWPQIVDHPLSMHGSTTSLLGGLSVVAILGLRYPLQILPLLMFEMVWKAIWLFFIALPLWRAHQIDPDTAESVKACLMGVIVPIVIPWRYVWNHYVRHPGDRWF